MGYGIERFEQRGQEIERWLSGMVVFELKY